MKRAEMEGLLDRLLWEEQQRCYWVKDMQWWLRRVKTSRLAGNRSEAREHLAHARRGRDISNSCVKVVNTIKAKLLEACHD